MHAGCPARPSFTPISSQSRVTTPLAGVAKGPRAGVVVMIVQFGGKYMIIRYLDP